MKTAAPSNPSIGCVPFLNAKPLIEGLRDRCVLDEPAVLARRFAEGALDAALLPVPAVLQMARPTVVRDIGICCRGPVHSVILAHSDPPETLTAIAPDPGSQSSLLLLQCLFREFHGFAPVFSDEARARLLIGDRALAFRENIPPGMRIMDMGSEWVRHTGLPFVFAVWVLREGMDAAPLAHKLRQCRDKGLAGVAEISTSDPGSRFLKCYYTEHLHFHLGDDELRGLRRFASLLQKHRLLDTQPVSGWRFV